MESALYVLQHDWRLKWPFRILVAGSSGSGKTTLVTRLVANSHGVMTRVPSAIVLFYSHMQPAYAQLKASAPCPVTLVHGGPPDDLVTKPGTLLIIDDLQASHAYQLTAWFTRKSHHMDTSLLYLVQNVFARSPEHRTISLNATHIVLFKNPRDSSQVMHLGKQIFPGSPDILTKAYDIATRNAPHTYMVIDFNQSTHDLFRLRNSLFPLEDFPNAYAYAPRQ